MKKELDEVLDTVKTRLQDTCFYYKEAKKNYFLPEDFRRSLNSCIMNSRTITFLLQKDKLSIPDFGSWYEIQQGIMKNDPNLIWLRDSRNSLEKEGDLDKFSELNMTLINSYTDKIPLSKNFIGIVDSIDDFDSKINILILFINNNQKYFRVTPFSYLEIQRRWVANTNPDHEILTTVANGLKSLLQILQNLIKHLDINVDINEIINELRYEIGQDEYRIMKKSISDGKHITFADRLNNIKKETLRSMMSNSEINESEMLVSSFQKSKSFKSNHETYFSTARHIFNKNSSFMLTFLLFRDKNLNNHYAPIFFDSDKQSLIAFIKSEILVIIKTEGIKSLSIAGEYVVREVQGCSDKDLQEAYKIAPKWEQLQQVSINSVGDCCYSSAKIIKKDNFIKLDGTSHNNGLDFNHSSINFIKDIIDYWQLKDIKNLYK